MASSVEPTVEIEDVSDVLIDDSVPINCAVKLGRFYLLKRPGDVYDVYVSGYTDRLLTIDSTQFETVRDVELVRNGCNEFFESVDDAAGAAVIIDTEQCGPQPDGARVREVPPRIERK